MPCPIINSLVLSFYTSSSSSLLLDKHGSNECINYGIPFLCQLTYGLCDAHDGIMYLPSRERCYYVTAFACAKELTGFTKYLPDCEQFQEQTHPKSMSNKTEYCIVNLHYNFHGFKTTKHYFVQVRILMCVKCSVTVISHYVLYRS